MRKFYTRLFRAKKPHAAIAKNSYPTSAMTPKFSWYLEIERGTLKHTIAIDSGMTLLKEDRDMLTYGTTDKAIWIEFQEDCKANHGAIMREFNDRYRR